MTGGERNSGSFDGLEHFGIKKSKFNEQMGHGLFAGLIYGQVESWNAPTAVEVKKKKKKKKGKKKKKASPGGGGGMGGAEE